MTETPEIQYRPGEAQSTMSAGSNQLSTPSLNRPDGSGLDPRLASAMGNQFDTTHKSVTGAGSTMDSGAQQAQKVGAADTEDAKKADGIQNKMKTNGKDGALGDIARAKDGAGRLTPSDLAKLTNPAGAYNSSMPTAQTAPPMPGGGGSMPQIPMPAGGPPLQNALGGFGAPFTQPFQDILGRVAQGAKDGGPAGLPMGPRLQGDPAKVQDLTQKVLGIDYAWGGGGANGPGQGTTDHGGPADAAGDYKKIGFDCSGLSQYFQKQLYGIDIPRTSQAQFGAGWATSNPQPGDLFFPSSAGRPPGHVAVYIGNNQVVEAPSSGQTVKISPVRAGEFRTYHMAA